MDTADESAETSTTTAVFKLRSVLRGVSALQVETSKIPGTFGQFYLDDLRRRLRLARTRIQDELWVDRRSGQLRITLTDGNGTRHALVYTSAYNYDTHQRRVQILG